MIIEPNYDAHTDTAVTNAATYYQQTITAATSGQNPVDYVGVKAAISDPIILKNTNPGCTGTGCGTVSSKMYKKHDECRKYSYMVEDLLNQCKNRLAMSAKKVEERMDSHDLSSEEEMAL